MKIKIVMYSESMNEQESDLVKSFPEMKFEFLGREYEATSYSADYTADGIVYTVEATRLIPIPRGIK